MLPLLAQLALAEPIQDLHPGEFRNTAETLPAGEIVIHPFLPSTLGIASGLDAKTNLLGWIGGPNASLEASFAAGDTSSVSIEPFFQTVWNVAATSAGATARFTTGVGEHQLHLGGGGGVYLAEGSSVLLLPVEAGFDLHLADHQQLRFFANAEVRSIAAGVPWASGGGTFNHAFGTFRLAVGVGVIYLDDDLRTAVFDLTDVTLPPLLPLPLIELWFRF